MSEVVPVTDQEHIATLRKAVNNFLNTEVVELDTSVRIALPLRPEPKCLTPEDFKCLYPNAFSVMPAPEGSRALLFVTGDGSYLVDKDFNFLRVVATTYEDVLEAKHKGRCLFETRLTGSKKQKTLHLSGFDCPMYRERCIIDLPRNQRLARTLDLQQRLDKCAIKPLNFLPYRVTPMYRLTNLNQMILAADRKNLKQWKINDICFNSILLMGDGDTFKYKHSLLYEWKIDDAKLPLEQLLSHISEPSKRGIKRSADPSLETKTFDKRQKPVIMAQVVQDLAQTIIPLWKQDSGEAWEFTLKVLSRVGTSLSNKDFHHLTTLAKEQKYQRFNSIQNNIIIIETFYNLQGIQLRHDQNTTENKEAWYICNTRYGIEADVVEGDRKFRLDFTCVSNHVAAAEIVGKVTPHNVNYKVRTSVFLLDADFRMDATVVSRGITLQDAKRSASVEYELDLEILRTPKNLTMANDFLAQLIMCTTFDMLEFSALDARCEITCNTFPGLHSDKGVHKLTSGHTKPLNLKKRFDGTY